MAGVALPFQPHLPIGHGAMATVWSGVHVAQRQPVAIKVLREAPGAHLEGEVRALGRLHHPAVARIFDVGSVPAAWARPGLDEGLAYLVMELASGGTLRDRCGQLDWPELRAVLATLLEALGHAHGHGILHLDLKPSNVLVAVDRDLSNGPLLADFGIAAWTDRLADRVLAGTPDFMAPEQFRTAGWLGPWTDLYAFGRMATALWTGQPNDTEGLERVPGLGPWLAWLLADHPIDRPASAAEALAALPAATAADAARVGAAAAWNATLVLDEPAPVTREPVPAEGPAEPRPRLTLPEAPDEARPPSLLLTSAGLALHELRTMPVLAREPERVALWQVARTAWTAGPRVAVLSGPSGIGKTALASWLVAALHRHGGADRVVVSGAEDAPLSRAMARWLAVEGASESAARVALGIRLPPALAAEEEGWLDLLGPSLDPPRPSRRASADRIGRVAEALAVAGRPVVWCVDDAHLAAEAVSALAALLDLEATSAVVGVLTWQDDAEAIPEASDRARRRLLGCRGAVAVPVGPMSDEDLAEALDRMLPLNSGLAAWLARSALGSPGTATARLGNLVADGALVAGPQGYTFTGGALPEVQGWASVWSTRVDRALRGLDDDARQALWLAAVGGALDASWRRTCEGAAADRVVAALDSAGLVVRDEAGGALPAHPVVLTELRRRAAAATGLAALHARWAEALADRPERVEARARHLAAAGRWEDAWGPLTEAAFAALDRSDLLVVRELLDRLREALSAMGVPDADPRRATFLRLEVMYLRNTWQGPQLAEASEAYVAACRTHGWAADLPWALWLRGASLRHVGRWADALALIEEGEGLPDLEPAVRARLLTTRAALIDDQGFRERAFELRDEAEAIYRQIGDEVGVTILGMIAILARARLDRGYESEAALADVGRRFERIGDREGQGRVALTWGTSLCEQGRHVEAEAKARTALRHFLVIGSPRSLEARLLLASVLIQRGRLTEAESEARRALEGCQGTERLHPRHNALSTLALIRARLGDADGMIEQVEALEALPLVDRLVPRHLVVQRDAVAGWMAAMGRPELLTRFLAAVVGANAPPDGRGRGSGQ